MDDWITPDYWSPLEDAFQGFQVFTNNFDELWIELR